MRLSDYDRRQYKTLSLSIAHNDRSSRSTFVITHVDIGGQGTNAADLLRKLSEASRKEEGNLGCDSHEVIPEQPWADRRQPSGRTSL
jgi:hypothetical protein